MDHRKPRGVRAPLTLTGKESDMTMRMTERQLGAVTILDLAGAITIDEGVERLRDKINSLVTQARTSVVLNLAEISYIDSSGLGQLVSCHRSLAGTTGRLQLLHVSKRNLSLLSLTGLATIFDLFDSEEEAVRSFPPPHAGASLPLGESLNPRV
jgi:anti-sigma B factor antagonist